MLGEPAKAMAMLDQAKRLDPFLPDYCREGETVGHYLLERYADVLEVNALSAASRDAPPSMAPPLPYTARERLGPGARPSSCSVSIRSSGSTRSLSSNPTRTRITPSD